MTTVADMSRRLDLFDLIEVTADAMEQMPDEIVELNRDQMNEQGVTSKGAAIKPEYSPFTVFEKNRKGQVFSHVTLRDTGEFQSKMHLIIKGKSFDISSTDSKTPDLVSKYGENIFGLTMESKKEAFSMLKPTIVSRFKEITGAI